MDANKLMLNILKTKLIMITTPANEQYKVKLQTTNSELHSKLTMKVLGIIFSDNLKWNDQKELRI